MQQVQRRCTRSPLNTHPYQYGKPSHVAVVGAVGKVVVAEATDGSAVAGTYSVNVAKCLFVITL